MAWHRGGWRLWALLVAALFSRTVAYANEVPRIFFPTPTPSGSLSTWNLLVYPRGADFSVYDPNRYLLEVYDPEVGWETFNWYRADGSHLSPDPVPPRQNDPVFFRFTDFDLDLSFTGYTAWDQPAGSYFTYPVSPEWREVFSITRSVRGSCDETFPFGCSVYSDYSIGETLDGPSQYLRRFRQGERLLNYSALEFLPDNNKYPREPLYHFTDFLGEPSGLSFADPQYLTNCVPYSGHLCETLAQGGVVFARYIDGYTSPSITTRIDPCLDTKLELLMIPASPATPSPFDVLPSGFPFPAPDQFITWAVEDMLIVKGDPVGFLKRSVEARGPVYSTASLSSLPVGEPIASDVAWPLPTVSAVAGTTITLPLVITGGVEHTGAVSLAVRLQSPVPLPLENVTAAASPEISGAAFRDRLRVIDEHTLEYRCLVTGDFSTTGTTTLSVLTVVLPPGLSPGDRIDLIPLVEPVENVLPTSMVRIDNRPVVNPACGDGPCQIAATPGHITLRAPITGADMWIVRGE